MGAPPQGMGMTGASFVKQYLVSAGGAVLLGLAACATVSKTPEAMGYQLVYHKPGTLSTGYAPGMGARKGGYVTSASGGLSIFTKGGLTYFSEPEIVTIYRPGDGIFVRVPVGYEQVRGDIDGTKNVNFRHVPSNVGWTLPTVVGVRNPDLIRIWDNAPSAPEVWAATFSTVAERTASRSWLRQANGAGQYKGESFYVTGKPIPNGASGDMSLFAFCERFMASAEAISAVPELASARMYSSQADSRAVRQQKENEERSRIARDQRAAIAQQAADSFDRAVRSPKRIGVTVCSSDNRVAYIEQVEGERVKLTVRGRAIGNYDEFGSFGPKALTAPATFFSGDANAKRPIEDPNFLFLPLPKPVQLTRESQALWDQGQYWGVCDYR